MPQAAPDAPPPALDEQDPTLGEGQPSSEQQEAAETISNATRASLAPVVNTSYFANINPGLAAPTPQASSDAFGKMRKKYRDAMTNPARGKLISTGVLGVDLCLFGGLHYGSVHEFYGVSKTGKSLLMASTARSAQRDDPRALTIVLDRENAWDVPRAVRFGLDPHRTIIIPAIEIPTPQAAYDRLVNLLIDLDTQGLSAEDLKEYNAALKKGGYFGRLYDEKRSVPVVVIIDSIPAFAEKQEMVEDQGRRAKTWHGILRRLTAVVDAQTMILVSNHITHKPTMYGSGETKSTGSAADYYRDCGIRCMKAHDILNANDVHVGSMLAINVDKTRRGEANSETYFPVRGGEGCSYFSGVLGYAQYLGVVKLANATAYKDGKGKVLPIVRYGGQVLEETDPDFQTKLMASGLLQAIEKAVQELF